MNLSQRGGDVTVTMSLSEAVSLRAPLVRLCAADGIGVNTRTAVRDLASVLDVVRYLGADRSADMMGE